MATEIPHTATCPDCGGLALCLNCNAKRVLEADAIARELAKCGGDAKVVISLIARARLYVKGGR